MKRNHRNPWYPHLGRRSLHLLYCPLCLSTYNMGRPVTLQAPIIQPAQQFPCRARQVYDTALCKDAVAMGLTNWSKLNTDLYNFQILTPSLPPANAQESAFLVTLRSRAPYSSLVWIMTKILLNAVIPGTQVRSLLMAFGRCSFGHACEVCSRDHCKATYSCKSTQSIRDLVPLANSAYSFSCTCSKDSHYSAPSSSFSSVGYPSFSYQCSVSHCQVL